MIGDRGLAPLAEALFVRVLHCVNDWIALWFSWFCSLHPDDVFFLPFFDFVIQAGRGVTDLDLSRNGLTPLGLSRSQLLCKLECTTQKQKPAKR